MTATFIIRADHDDLKALVTPLDASSAHELLRTMTEAATTGRTIELPGRHLYVAERSTHPLRRYQDLLPGTVSEYESAHGNLNRSYTLLTPTWRVTPEGTILEGTEKHSEELLQSVYINAGLLREQVSAAFPT